MKRAAIFLAAAPVIALGSCGLVAVGSATVLTGTTVRTQPAAAVQLPQSPCRDVPAGKLADLTTEQAANAKTIVQVAGRVIPARAGQAAVVGIATAMQESTLRNLTYGDRDSVGLFQQRPSAGWGTVAELTTPETAARKFFDALAGVPSWWTMPVTAAAQRVQRSAFPTAYAKWEPLARATVAALSGAPARDCAPPAGGHCPESGSTAERGLTPDALMVLRCAAARWQVLHSFGGVGPRPNPSDHGSGRAVDLMIPGWRSPGGKALGDEVAEFFRVNADKFGVTYVIWDARIWSVARNDEGWRPYQHPNGPTTDPTLMHLDHVHVSVRGSGGSAGWGS